MSSIESFITLLPVFTMSAVTHVDKKLYSITEWVGGDFALWY